MGATPQRFSAPLVDKSKRRKGARVPAAVFPAAPIEGDIFWKTDTNDLWVWDGSSWRQITII